jgi:hypothetical protein
MVTSIPGMFGRLADFCTKTDVEIYEDRYTGFQGEQPIFP